MKRFIRFLADKSGVTRQIKEETLADFKEKITEMKALKMDPQRIYSDIVQNVANLL